MILLRFALASLLVLLPSCSCAISHTPDDAGAPDGSTPDGSTPDGSTPDAAERDAADVDAAIVPGTCGTPLALIDASHLDADGVYRAHVETEGRLDEVSCPRDGPSTEVSGRVVRLVASVPGDWTLRAYSTEGSTSQLRADCADTTSELECHPLAGGTPDVSPTVWHVTAAGETVDWLLRSRVTAGTFDVEAWPPRLEGDSCAVFAGDASMISVGCVPPLRCQNWAPMPTCATNTAPTLERVELYRDGSASSGHLILWGTDTTPNLYSLRGTSTGGAGFFEYYVTAPRFDGSSFVIDFYEPVPAGAFDVVVSDLVSTSNAVHAVVQPPGVGEPCARLGACPAGLACLDDGAGTLRCQP